MPQPDLVKTRIRLELGRDAFQLVIRRGPMRKVRIQPHCHHGIRPGNILHPEDNRLVVIMIRQLVGLEFPQPGGLRMR